MLPTQRVLFFRWLALVLQKAHLATGKQRPASQTTAASCVQPASSGDGQMDDAAMHRRAQHSHGDGAGRGKHQRSQLDTSLRHAPRGRRMRAEFADCSIKPTRRIDG